MNCPLLEVDEYVNPVVPNAPTPLPKGTGVLCTDLVEFFNVTGSLYELGGCTFAFSSVFTR